MQRLIAGERTDLERLDRTLLRELRLRLRGRDVVQHLPPGCRLWVAGLDEVGQVKGLTSGPAVPGVLWPSAEGEDRVPGVILRLEQLERSAPERFQLGVVWASSLAAPPLTLELRTATRVVAAIQPEAPTAGQPGGKAGGALLLAEVYRRSGTWRIRNYSEWLGGPAALERRWGLTPGRLSVGAPPSPAPLPPAPDASARPAPPLSRPVPPPVPAPEPTPVPVTPPASPQPLADPPTPLPAGLPHEPTPPSLSGRLAELWARLRRPEPDLVPEPALEQTSGQAAPPTSAGGEVSLPPRTARSFAAIDQQLQVLREVLAEEQSRNPGIGGEMIRHQARLETLQETYTTLRQEALELERRRAQAARLGLSLPPSVLDLEGEIERTYRALVRALEDQAQTLLHGTAQGSRERLGRETLFLETLGAERPPTSRDKGPLDL
ncbi:hypothetical protein [Deinococcus radiophilus]|uniref:TerD domain-containing protein n=1 Tax=Deinococcus radiophilus TaxID=32062 RepID=A0A3S0JQG7_9DEIO|nr:hypothetical protein [Deinococcus radiophilus]RTR26841.1 hypothetical protein EJ104_07540 [Deinococcus radiophilus]